MADQKLEDKKKIPWKKSWYVLSSTYLVGSVTAPLLVAVEFGKWLFVLINLVAVMMFMTSIWLVISGILNVFRNKGLGRLGVAGVSIAILVSGMILSNMVFLLIVPSMK